MAKMKKYHGTKKSYLLNNDMSAIANMPQEARIASYPECDYMSQEYGDTLEYLDSQENKRIASLRSQYKPRR